MSLANKYPCVLVSLFLIGCAADAEPEPERADPEKREARAERAESQAFDQAADVSVTGSLLYTGQSLWSVPVVSPCGPSLWSVPVVSPCGQSLWSVPVVNP